MPAKDLAILLMCVISAAALTVLIFTGFMTVIESAVVWIIIAALLLLRALLARK